MTSPSHAGVRISQILSLSFRRLFSRKGQAVNTSGFAGRTGSLTTTQAAVTEAVGVATFQQTFITNAEV